MQVFRCQTRLLAIDTMKKCIKCNNSKSLDLFYKDKSKKDGHTSYCKVCSANKSKSHYANNKEAAIKRASDWYANNKEYRQAYRRKHYLENKGQYNSSINLRRAAKLKATPSWLTEKQLNDIYAIYKSCAKITERTGKAHHVDHIIPLQGVDVCGLHVPWNLAILPASMNLAKHNKHNSWDTK